MPVQPQNQQSVQLLVFVPLYNQFTVSLNSTDTCHKKKYLNNFNFSTHMLHSVKKEREKRPHSSPLPVLAMNEVCVLSETIGASRKHSGCKLTFPPPLNRFHPY